MLMQYSIRPIIGLREEQSFEITAPKSAAHVAVDCDDHALARGMSVILGKLVGNCEFPLFILECA
jgi:hypothetical protein